jgi:crotonobetainyl-CoA:carnitine CoA-transferase CaiB-like acyl-CoA transferase
MPVPLTGLTVVSVEQAVAAPFATRQLADLGARVIKVERPGTGDFARHYDATVKGLASYFVWLNRGKQSLSLDLKKAAGRSVLDRLIDRADVFVQNLAPGAAARMGLTAEVLRARDERLIVCDISGYAPDGHVLRRRSPGSDWDQPRDDRALRDVPDRQRRRRAARGAERARVAAELGLSDTEVRTLRDAGTA